jgi:hypothetical protein
MAPHATLQRGERSAAMGQTGTQISGFAHARGGVLPGRGWAIDLDHGNAAADRVQTPATSHIGGVGEREMTPFSLVLAPKGYAQRASS